MGVGRHQPHPARHGPAEQGRAERHCDDHRAHAERVADELPKGGKRSFAGQRGADDDQENRQRAAQGAGGIGDAEQERVPQALLSLHPTSTRITGSCGSIHPSASSTPTCVGSSITGMPSLGGPPERISS